MRARQDEVMVVHTLAFMIVRQVLRLVGLGPSPNAKDVELAVLRTNYWSCAASQLTMNVHRVDDTPGVVRPVW
jgi:hypothetical protein